MNPNPAFTYNIQLSHYREDQTDEKGVIDARDFRTLLYNFPWTEQLRSSNENKDHISATISVVHHETDTVLWVSIAGEVERPSYIIGYNYKKPAKGFLGFGRTKQHVDTYQVHSLDEVYRFFELYFMKKQEELESNLQMLEKF